MICQAFRVAQRGLCKKFVAPTPKGMLSFPIDPPVTLEAGRKYAMGLRLLDGIMIGGLGEVLCPDKLSRRSRRRWRGRFRDANPPVRWLAESVVPV
jgi:hypothetical protein